jgi:hypothetical protein
MVLKIGSDRKIDDRRNTERASSSADPIPDSMRIWGEP